MNSQLNQIAADLVERNRLCDAWAILEELSPEAKATPDVVDLRLRILCGMEKWELGECLAQLMATSPEIEHRKTAARFYLARARDEYAGFEFETARGSFRKAVDAWVGIRAEFSDHDLEALVS